MSEPAIRVPYFRSLAAAVLCAAVAFAAPAAAQSECTAPAAVCAVRGAVFALSSPFDPLASAVLVAPGEAVANRHAVADETAVELRLADGERLTGEVVPGVYPGDLVLLRVPGLGGRPPPVATAGDGPLYVVGAESADGSVRVYRPGRASALPAEGYPRARLHHSAQSQPGNSGGALVDEAGRLVGIVTAGGEGRNNAIPASEIAALRKASGPQHAAASRALGAAYRTCIEGLEGAAADSLANLADLANLCRATGNRELLDLAAQAAGRGGDFDTSEALFREALALDPNGVNTRLGLAVTLHLAGRWGPEAVVLGRLVEELPADFPVLRMAVQAGKFSGDTQLAGRALELIAEHHPDALAEAREFLAN